MSATEGMQTNNVSVCLAWEAVMVSQMYMKFRAFVNFSTYFVCVSKTESSLFCVNILDET